MKFKSIVPVTAACCAAALLLAGCGEKEQASTLNIDKTEFLETGGLQLPITDEKATVEVLTSSTVDGLDSKLFAQGVRELTGVNLKYSVVPSSQYAQRLQMLLSSKDLPDIFDDALNRSDLEMLAKNKAIVNFAEMGDQLPNISELFLNNPEHLELAGNYMVDDGLYVVPGYNIARDINHGFMYRKDVFERLGIKPWTNTDEFYQALQTLKQTYPDSVPFSSKSQIKLVANLAPGWGLDGTGISRYQQEGDYVYAGTHTAMRELLDFLHKLYADGLLDPEFLTCTDAQWASNMTQDTKSFVTFDWVDRMDLFYEQIKDQNPNYNLSFGYPIGPDAGYIRLPKVGNAAMAVSNNKNAEVSAKLLDFLVSPAGAKLATLGVKGISYEEVDGAVEYKLPEGTQPNINTLEEQYGLFTQGIAVRFDPQSVYYQFTPHVQEAQDMVVEKNLLKEKPIVPLVIDEGLDEYNGILTELNTQFETFASKYIVGADSLDTLWNSWVDQAKALGAERMVEIANANR